jgi:UDP-2-acetamido-2-deoxy-ribo-hexuluronate aminotransferase
MHIPFIDLKSQYAALKSDIDARIAAVLDHGAYIMGPEVRELEEQLAEFAGAKHAVAVSSGTDALLVALMAAGVGPGDAVFVPALTFTATAEVILVAGATPVFVDVDPKTCNIDPDDLTLRIEQTIEKGALRPKAIIAVDLYGLPADYAAINAIAQTHDLLVIDDGAQAFGATLRNKRVGALAEVTATSFFPAKPLGCYGDGGAVFTDDDDQAALFKSIRVHGSGATKYEVARVGLNARMDTIQAAVLLAKLSVFEKELVAREALATLYDDRLGDTVERQARIPGTTRAWAQYTVMTDYRDALAAHLKGQGIPTAIYYPSPMHLQTAYREYGDGAGSLPVAEQLSHRVLSFPMHPYMDEETANGICDAILGGLETVSN